MSDLESAGPKISIQAGFAIGYKSALATAADEMELAEGTHYLLARNGRGKTTLLRSLAGVLQLRGGDFTIVGQNQFLSEDICFDRELPAKLIFKCLLPKVVLPEVMDLAQKLELDTKLPYGKLSTGNQRKVALIMAEYAVDPDQGNILLLDEPFTGMDVYAREIFQDLWKSRKNGILRVLSCHPDQDSMVMESALIISDGKLYHLAGAEKAAEWRELKKELH